MAVPRFLHNCPHEVVYRAKRPTGTAAPISSVHGVLPWLFVQGGRPCPVTLGNFAAAVGWAARTREKPLASKRRLRNSSVSARGWAFLPQMRGSRWTARLSFPPIFSPCGLALCIDRWNRAVRRSRADRPLLRWRCRGGRRRFWFLARSSLMASLMAAVASLMAAVAPGLAAVHSVGPGGLSGRGGGRSGLLCFCLQRLQRRR